MHDDDRPSVAPVGPAIKHLRLERKLSQAGLATLITVDQTLVSRWERGTATPRHENLVRLSEALGVTLEGLQELARQLDRGEDPTTVRVSTHPYGAFLAALRKKQNVSYSELSEKAALDASALARYESGRTSMELDVFDQLIKLLGHDPLAILRREVLEVPGDSSGSGGIAASREGLPAHDGESINHGSDASPEGWGDPYILLPLLTREVRLLRNRVAELERQRDALLDQRDPVQGDTLDDDLPTE